jgi:hypothetical protein
MALAPAPEVHDKLNDLDGWHRTIVSEKCNISRLCRRVFETYVWFRDRDSLDVVYNHLSERAAQQRRRQCDLFSPPSASSASSGGPGSPPSSTTSSAASVMSSSTTHENFSLASIHHLLGVAYQCGKRREQAEREYRTALSLTEHCVVDNVVVRIHRAQYFIDLGSLFLKHGKIDDARQFYEQCIALAPTNAR